MLGNIDLREGLENKISGIIQKLGIEIKSVLDIGELWKFRDDLEKNRGDIYRILDSEGIGEGEIIFQKVSVFKSNTGGFMIYSDANFHVNYKYILDQYNASRQEGKISKGKKTRRVKTVEEADSVIGVNMESGMMMPFTTNSSTVVFLKKQNDDMYINFRTSNNSCNIIKYGDLKKLYIELEIEFFEYDLSLQKT